ncbi:hypothetical protein CkaCkLH20_11181 [Colletotrichum karsti]|uniref:Uncharacterized protein n=1 Tax=Colletotrichum karsti TaxID=1095194 RepID=A0A9P6LG56_9PEZI|nr:uncharacterized protein CkaCkLH20_11181 [Colletotrichum karsti]KAF9871260.1 hypothetical protein CkaCkLH20_11181 [Colletotrichum karsti]
MGKSSLISRASFPINTRHPTTIATYSPHNELGADMTQDKSTMACPLFRLPRELRDLVYWHYLVVQDGYLCDQDTFATGKLKRADGQPRSSLDLALVYTCKRIAHELDRGGLALALNTITFTTLYSDHLTIRAHVFGSLVVDGLGYLRTAMLNSLAPSLPEQAVAHIRAAYPQFAPLLHGLRSERPPVPSLSRVANWHLMNTRHGPYGETPSVYRDFVRHALRVAVDNPEVVPAIRAWLPPCPSEAYTDVFDPRYWYPHGIIGNTTEPWDIPSPAELATLEASLSADRHIKEIIAQNDRSKYRFSAAAAAIHFLRSAPHHTRKHMRKVVLREDHEAVAHPESHALGLVPFCREYPLLRIERRVSLWTNVFLPDLRYPTPAERCGHVGTRSTPSLLHSDQITGNLAPWVMEAAALGPAGMPPGSFSLVLADDGVPELCTQIFDCVVHRDVAWQQAWVASVGDGLSWPERRGQDVFRYGRPHPRAIMSYREPQTHEDRPGFWGYFFEDFPQAVRDMVDGTSNVRCEFFPGTPWDVAELIVQARTWGPRAWEKEWFKHSPAHWETAPPLPNWEAILKGELKEQLTERELRWNEIFGAQPGGPRLY